MSMSKQQFFAKHAKAYASLTPEEKAKRYADYSASVSSNIPQKKGRTLATGKLPRVRTLRTEEANYGGKMSGVVINKPFLSGCSSLYAKALVDPFGNFPMLPCIPDVINLPSFKLQTNNRGVLQIGTIGVGYVAVCPFVPVGDAYNAIYTNNLFTGNNFQTAGTGVVASYNDSPLTVAQFASTLNTYRTVGCGVRVNFMGSEFNRGGQVILHREPSNFGVNNGNTSATLLITKTSTQAPAVRKSETVCYRPDTQAQLGYRIYVPVGDLGGPLTMLIYIDGATPGQSWSYEIVTFYEVIGSLNNPTASHSDPTGMGAVMSALPNKISVDTPKTQLKTVLEGAESNIAHATSGMVATTTTPSGAASEPKFEMPSMSTIGKGIGLIGDLASFLM